MALDADRKNGPAARSFAADAHDCIMVRIKRPYRIQVCGTKMRPQWRAPLGFSKIDRHRQTLKLCRKKAPVAGHHRSACSGVKALRNTSDARRQAAKLCYRFGPLTPSARSANLIAGDGTKNGLSRSEQKTLSTSQNNRLTGKAPYKSSANLTADDVTGPDFRTGPSREPVRKSAEVRRECTAFKHHRTGSAEPRRSPPGPSEGSGAYRNSPTSFQTLATASRAALAISPLSLAIVVRRKPIRIMRAA